MIELRHLRYFVAVAEDLSFTQAAKRVHIDQTPLSRAVRDLEDDLEVQLFVRKPRQLMLTPAGARLLEEARELFVHFERAKRVVRQTNALYQPALRIGIADGIGQLKLSECLAEWQAMMPAVPLELSEMRAHELATALCQEEVDVGFSFGIPDDERIAQDVAWSYPLVALLPQGHELARMSSLSLDELMRFPMIACHPTYKPGVRQQIDDIVRRCGCNPLIAGEASTFTGYVMRISVGMGVGLIDGGQAATLHRGDIIALPLADDFQLHTFVLHKHQRCIADRVKRFLMHVSNLT